jgi:hypothetical protein
VELIEQGVNKLASKAAVIRCREVDVALVKAAMQDAERANKGLKLTLVGLRPSTCHPSRHLSYLHWPSSHLSRPHWPSLHLSHPHWPSRHLSR